MTKKKHREHPLEKTAEPAPADAAITTTEQDPAPSSTSSPDVQEPLMEEVQSFFHKRAELARKLADEIEATEQKLAELKRTAAMLFPENGNGNGQKDRKPKKPKPKVTSREEKTETAAGGEEAAAVAAAEGANAA